MNALPVHNIRQDPTWYKWAMMTCEYLRTHASLITMLRAYYAVEAACNTFCSIKVLVNVPIRPAELLHN